METDQVVKAHHKVTISLKELFEKFGIPDKAVLTMMEKQGISCYVHKIATLTGKSNFDTCILEFKWEDDLQLAGGTL